MNRSLFVVTVVGFVALAMIMSTVVTSDVLADSKREWVNKNVDRHIEEGRVHGDKAQEIKNRCIVKGKAY
jgi:hypothetical protein